MPVGSGRKTSAVLIRHRATVATTTPALRTDLRAAGHSWAKDQHQHGDGSRQLQASHEQASHEQASVIQRAKSSGTFAHSHEGDDDLSKQLVLDQVTALQLHTQQIYDQMREHGRAGRKEP